MNDSDGDDDPITAVLVSPPATRHFVAQFEWLIQLHARGEFLRPGQLHVPRLGWRPDFQPGDGDD